MVKTPRKATPARKPAVSAKPAAKAPRKRAKAAVVKPPAPPRLPRAKTPVQTAVRRDLKAIAEVDASLAAGALAEAALVLARELDDVRTSDTARGALIAIGDADDLERCHEISRLALERINVEHQNTAAEKASCARALLATLEQVRALMPAERAGDAIDDLAKRREQRLAAGA